MKGLLDASALGVMLFNDRGATTLADWADANLRDPWISDFAWGELTSAVGVRVRTNTIHAKAAAQLLEEFATGIASWRRVETRADDLRRATFLVSRFDVPLRFADAIHIAIAERIEATLVTSDRQQHRAARACDILSLNPLEDIPPK